MGSPLFFILLFLISSFAFSIDHQHKTFDDLLKSYVSYTKHNSDFDFTALSKNQNDLKKLKIYLENISSLKKNTYEKMTDDEKIALLINLHNAVLISTVIENLPLKSIKDIDKGFFGLVSSEPFGKMKISFLGEEVSLAKLLHERIRRNFNEPRFHFALYTGAKGSPRIRNEAYKSSILESQLKDQTAVFMTDRSRNQFNRDENRLYVSKVFDWYRADFRKRYGTMLNFLLPYFTKDLDEFNKLRKTRIKIRHLEYDWSINQK